MDWNVIAQYLPLYKKAAWLTLRLGLAGIVIAIVVGLVCALVQYYKVPVLRRIVGAYIELSRNTPLLVQLFFRTDDEDCMQISCFKHMKQCFASFYIKMAGDKWMSVMIIRDQLWKIQITSNP